MSHADPISADLRDHLRKFVDNFLHLPQAQQDEVLAEQLTRFNEPGDVVLIRGEVVQAYSGELEVRVPSPGGSTRFFVRTNDTVTI